MSYAGSVSAMITSLKNNSRQKKSLFDKKTKMAPKGKSEAWKKVLAQKASPKQLEEIRIEIQEENKTLNFKRLISILIALGITGIIVASILYSFSNEGF